MRLLQSDHPALLVTWGLVQPKVILPRRRARTGPTTRIRVVLSHELAHIKRGDWLIQMLAELLRAGYWFNPVMWIACRRLRLESEQATDDVVLHAGHRRHPTTPSHLLELARAFRAHRPWLPAPAIARPSSLERRVSAMLNRSLNRAPLTRTAALGIVVALLTVALPLAGLVASAQATAQFSGTLVDTVGRVLPDTPMTIANTQTQQKHVTRSDGNGHFAFTGLTGGDYVLSVERMGFATMQGRVALAAGQSLMQDVALQIGSLQETITVTDGPPAPPRAGAGRRIEYTPPPSACSQATVGGCIEQPVKLRDVKPKFPAQFAGTGRTATLNFESRIGVDGFINDLRVVTPGEPEFAAAAMEAIQQWEFSQTRLDGVPVEVKMKIAVTFRPQP